MTIEAPPSSATTAKSSRRTLWIALPIAAVVVIGLAIAAIVAIGSAAKPAPGNHIPSDPANYGADGASALAGIVGGHGVDVTTVRGLADLSVTPRPGPDTTVVVTNSAVMTGDTARAFAERVRGARRVVLIGPSTAALTRLDLPVTVGPDHWSGARVRADCSIAGISPTDEVTPGPESFITRPGARTASCFPDSPDELAPFASVGAQIVLVPADATHPETVVMDSTMTANAGLTDADNAGVAVRTIAGTDHVLWYVPSAADRVSGEDEQSILPAIVWPLFFLGFFVAVALMVWRGRRFGALASEPLPAVVKAIETTVSRGRLYRKAADSGRAAAILRIHTIASIARYLGLPSDPGRPQQR